MCVKHRPKPVRRERPLDARGGEVPVYVYTGEQFSKVEWPFNPSLGTVV